MRVLGGPATAPFLETLVALEQKYTVWTHFYFLRDEVKEVRIFVTDLDGGEAAYPFSVLARGRNLDGNTYEGTYLDQCLRHGGDTDRAERYMEDNIKRLYKAQAGKGTPCWGEVKSALLECLYAGFRAESVQQYKRVNSVRKLNQLLHDRYGVQFKPTKMGQKLKEWLAEPSFESELSPNTVAFGDNRENEVAGTALAAASSTTELTESGVDLGDDAIMSQNWYSRNMDAMSPLLYCEGQGIIGGHTPTQFTFACEPPTRSESVHNEFAALIDMCTPNGTKTSMNPQVQQLREELSNTKTQLDNALTANRWKDFQLDGLRAKCRFLEEELRLAKEKGDSTSHLQRQHTSDKSLMSYSGSTSLNSSYEHMTHLTETDTQELRNMFLDPQETEECSSDYLTLVIPGHPVGRIKPATPSP